MFFYCFFQFFWFFFFFFFFNDTATTEIYTLSLHDALPILPQVALVRYVPASCQMVCCGLDRKSTRLNSSHMSISYAVFCLKKKKKQTKENIYQKKKKTDNMPIQYNKLLIILPNFFLFFFVFLYSFSLSFFFFFFFFNDTATTEIYTLSLHDALPIFKEEAKLHLATVLGAAFEARDQ